MFRGINVINIDGKGRLAVPTRYREALGQDHAALVVTIDPEETCLLLYPAREWQVIEGNLQRLPSFNAAARRIQRLLIGHATDVELDGNGRVLLPPLLREYARLSKRVVLIGQGNKFEVWDDELWQTKREQWLAEESSGKAALPDEMKTFSL
ncbi:MULTISPECIES: division/cell wall cluster transcriptional repressor MraZ [Legionella]|uniref:Transcriptional regulator MraZ n=1 Tax=Legionella septentrionalis TaxID=2498109 RepID=A0A433JK74_9GAMM|nr:MULTISPECIES: division/cell wall cluster transcriptional repressor MraZ [Legionella]MCP0914315.1 division/cell wall cluster transcriptional repressor MraZ [Legionella sp. 27cVA30]RUQ89024.1 transcriptional regulator MraZ [Legionella septentrionalis]RUR00331.1 transcriptional regulator MraZ [Legionella septentrionalis]RUR11812.1 transcriptional regulator MraZ [Legionella septentrionalis]RUR17500.1 transcriptional regulator MraZ [Legionella septentrionalis]